MVSPRNGVFVAVAVMAVALSACAAKPRERPLPIGDIASGPNTVEAARKQLQGSWVLSSLNVTGPDGRTGAIDAAGSMNFDGFGNMNIEYRMSEAGLKTLEGLRHQVAQPGDLHHRQRRHQSDVARGHLHRPGLREAGARASTPTWPPSAPTRSRSNASATTRSGRTGR